MFGKIVIRARTLVVALSVAALGASAWAQDYTVTTATGKLETRPAGAVATGLPASNTSTNALVVSLPFEFPYYGRVETSVLLTASGFVLPERTTIFLNPNSNLNAPGRDATSLAFPFTPQGLNGSSSPNADGIIAPFWDSLGQVPGAPNNGDTYYWTAGSAPTRHFVVSWESFVANSSNPRITVQLHLYEGSGRIVFAYDTNVSGYAGTTYVCGIDSLGDGRFIAPLLATRTNTGYPGSDFIFDPRTVTHTGRLLFDKLVSDASGIGNTVMANQPLANMQVEVRRDGGILASHAVTDASGNFTIPSPGVAASSSGTIIALAQNDACRVVTTTGGSALSWSALASLSFSSSSNVGTITLGAGADASGAVRMPFNIARICDRVRSWAQPNSTATIPQLEVTFNSAVASSTNYLTGAGGGSPALVVASSTSGNLDAWDDAILARTYGRHVFSTIVAPPATTADYRFDAVSDPQNAFIEAFGYYLWSVVAGSSQAIDGMSASNATVFDLESPVVTVAKGADVAGCVAGALHDVLDGANETIDPIDGTSTPARVLQLVDAFTVTPTAGTFLDAWVAAGHDAPGITRAFVGNGALRDDGLEPNDSRTESSSLGPIGVRRSGLVLNRFDEDWSSVTLPTSVTSLVAEMAFAGTAIVASVTVEIRDGTGALVATATGTGASGPIRATGGPLVAGTYRVGVRHVSGATIPDYTVQAFVPLDIAQVPLRDWTVGQPFDESVGVSGGIAPYTLSTVSSSMPPGLGLSSANQRAVGTPSTVGTFPLTIQVRDDGRPANVLARSQTVTIHEVLEIALPQFVGFPAGKTVALSLPTAGGTPPFTIGMTSGTLPSGLVFAPNSLHVTGTAGPGTTSFALDATDVAGSTDHVAARAVVAVELTGKNIPSDLAAGDEACGWWFDAVAGSAVSFKATTAKGRAKRTLAGVVLAPDRSVVATGSIKAKPGSLTGSKIVCPLSGRHFVIASSTSGDATQLLATLAVAAPKSGKSSVAGFAASDTTTIAIGALPGAALTLKFGGDKKAGLVAKVVGLVDPSGTSVPFAGLVTGSALGGTLKATLATGGTWKVVLGATSSSGNPGKLAYSYSLKQPKGGVYSAD